MHPHVGISRLFNCGVIKSATDQTPVVLSAHCPHPTLVSQSHSLDIEDGVLWVHSSLVLGGLTDETLLGGEGDERWGGEASLLVGDCEALC